VGQGGSESESGSGYSGVCRYPHSESRAQERYQLSVVGRVEGR